MMAAAMAAGLGVLALAAGGCCAFSGRKFRGPPSDHFDGRRFRNRAEVPEHGLREFLRWVRERDRGPWREYDAAPQGSKPVERVGTGQMRVTFVGHSTLLVQMDGLNLLTDPIWSDRASPVSVVGPRRVRPPGIRFEDLPPIDVVLVSHGHYDHLDLRTLQQLARSSQPKLIVSLGNRRLLDQAGLRGAAELDWWHTIALGNGVRVTGVPAQHFSNRGMCDQNSALWNGYVIQGPAGAAFFAGDTGYGPHFREIGERFGPLRLAMLPIGAFRPRWFMGSVHLAPDEAVRAQIDLGAETAVAMHFGTFRLADDGQDEPVVELEKALSTHEPRPRFWTLGFGEGRDLPALASTARPAGSAKAVASE